MELPQLFVEKMKSLLGEEYSDYEACLKRPKQNGIRVNTSKISVEEFQKIAPFETEPVRGRKTGFLSDQKSSLRSIPFIMRVCTIFRNRAPWHPRHFFR